MGFLLYATPTTPSPAATVCPPRLFGDGAHITFFFFFFSLISTPAFFSLLAPSLPSGELLVRDSVMHFGRRKALGSRRKERARGGPNAFFFSGGCKQPPLFVVFFDFFFRFHFLPRPSLPRFILSSALNALRGLLGRFSRSLREEKRRGREGRLFLKLREKAKHLHSDFSKKKKRPIGKKKKKDTLSRPRKKTQAPLSPRAPFSPRVLFYPTNSDEK